MVALDRLSRKDFLRIVENRLLFPLEEDDRMFNLARGYWVYDELIRDLKAAGWIRFGAGFKAGVYGHPRSDFCIKVMGMGIGQDPLYFCERGYYLEHERTMLNDFAIEGFDFAPAVLDIEESIEFLVSQCKVAAYQAELRVRKHDLLVIEYIPGVPLAIQTGHGLNCDLSVDAFDSNVVEEMSVALSGLAMKLQRANAMSLLHNDPTPPNIVFSVNERNHVIARLVDFELAQNLRKTSPRYVDSTVAALYRERNVPINPINSTPVTSMDQHLMEGALNVTRQVLRALIEPSDDGDRFAPLSMGISFFGEATFRVGEALGKLRRMMAVAP
jgi:hypothetical protein